MFVAVAIPLAVGDNYLGYRLVGTRVAQYTGFDFTGRYLDEMVFQGRDFMEECYRLVMTDRRPVFGHYAWLVRSRHFGQPEDQAAHDGGQADGAGAVEGAPVDVGGALDQHGIGTAGCGTDLDQTAGV